MSKSPKNLINLDPGTTVFIIFVALFLPLLLAGFLFQ